MARTVIEERLSDDVRIMVTRYRDPDGALRYALGVQAATLAASGEEVRQVALQDVFNRMTPAQRAAVAAQADAIISKMAAALEVTVS